MRHIAVLCTVILAGCTYSDPPEEFLPPAADEASCERNICLADPDGRDSKTMLDIAGLRQVTADGRTEKGFAIDGEWMYWGVPQPRGGPQIAFDLYATQLGSGILARLVESDSVHAILPKASHGHVVWSQLENQPGIYVWNASRDETRRVETAPGGWKAIGFDYPWIVYYAGADTWAQNLDTHEKILVYNDTMLERKEHYSTYRGADVGGSKAVYGVSYANEARNHYNGTFYVFDLANRARFSLDWTGHGINNFRTNGAQTIIESGLVVYLLNHETGEFLQISNDESKLCGGVSIGSTWASFACEWESFAYRISDGRVLHLPTPGETYAEAGLDVPIYIPMETTTDGRRWVVQVQTRDPGRFEQPGTNLFWMDLPHGAEDLGMNQANDSPESGELDVGIHA